ncbi:MAG TPA: PIN domain-containing protein [Gemmataceae bacterium]|nr:PIN domain-containing protein [Gemmataceae bacterium]
MATQRIYFDPSSLGRAFDDLAQERNRREADAVEEVLRKIAIGDWLQVSSTAATLEIAAIPDVALRRKMELRIPTTGAVHQLNATTFSRATELCRLGFKPLDALHVAAAEELNADVLLSCDDQLCRTANRHTGKLAVPVRNPVDWLKEITHGQDP